jgi:hypothetical protein
LVGAEGEWLEVIVGQVGRLRRTVRLGRCRWCASGLQQVADGGPVFVGVC